MSKITTFLTFASGAEDAVKFYTSLFKNSKIGKTTHYGDAGKDAPSDIPPAGSVMTIDFELDGTPYIALNGGSYFKFSEAVSLQISVDTQEEVDRLTEQLTAGGGEEGPCGWVKDRWGLSWQITPKILPELVANKDPVKAQKAMSAMMKMKRIDIAELKRAVGL